MSTTRPDFPYPFRGSGSLLGYQWLIRGVSATVQGGLTHQECEGILSERKEAAQLEIVSRTIPVVWVDDRWVDVRFIAHRGRLRNAWRRYSDLTFNGHWIHLEAFGGVGGGPGFGVEEIRLYVDGTIRGRTFKLGCSLGISGGADRAVALLRSDLALSIALPGDAIQVMRAAEPPSPNKTTARRFSSAE